VTLVPEIVDPPEEPAEFSPDGILRWSPVAGADVYEVRMYRDSSLVAFAEALGPLRITQYHVTSLTPGTTFYVQGIGQPTYTKAAQYGSAGRLRAVIHLSMRNGPSLHELLHAWANFIVPTGIASHWNFSSSGGGQLGAYDGNTFTDLRGGPYQASNGRAGSTGFGTVANGGNTVPYSDLELYLMGMCAADGVPVLHVASNPVWVDGGNGLQRRWFHHADDRQHHCHTRAERSVRGNVSQELQGVPSC
jgi:hypothetical protein